MKKKTPIARAVAKHGISVTTMSRDLGVTRMAVYKWIGGASTPSPDRITKVCTYLGLTPNEIYGWKK